MKANVSIGVFTAGLITVLSAYGQTTSSSFQHRSGNARVGGGFIGGASTGASASAGGGFGVGVGPRNLGIRGANYYYILPKGFSRARARSLAKPEPLVAGEPVAGSTQGAATDPAAPTPEPLNQPQPFYLGDAPSGFALSASVPETPAAKTSPFVVSQTRPLIVEKGEKERTDRVHPISEAKGPVFDDRDPLLGYQQAQAEKGNPEAQFALGIRYVTGNGVERNEALGREWLEKASSQGNLRARSKLRELSVIAADF